MKEMTVNAPKATIFQKIVRYGLIIIGAFLFVMPQYLVEGNIIYLLKVFGILMLAPAAANPFSIFGGNDKLILTDEFVKITDELTLTRTAYWNKINKATLTRFSLRVYYGSGAGENFRIPYTSKPEFAKLRSQINQKSTKYNFDMQEKPWWKGYS